MELLSLPEVMIENILSYLSYDEIAKNRIVCKAFDDTCRKMLNRGFLLVERRHALTLKNVKAQLPRRESERRYHPLSRHCDILSSIETRISMLNMTYSKYIDTGICCFVPGKVIDEIRRVLTIAEGTQTPPRAHEVLQELRDISSMAIEHFDDKISPAFRKKLQQGIHVQTVTQDSALGPLALKQELVHIKRRSLLNAKLSLHLATQYKTFYKRLTVYKKINARQRKTIHQMTLRQNEQDAAIADLKKRIEECDIRYSELTHTNQAVGGKSIAASPSSEVSPSSSQQPLRNFASQIKLDLSLLPIGSKRNESKSQPNIKPRKPLMRLSSTSDDDTKPDTGRESNPERLYKETPEHVRTENKESNPERLFIDAVRSDIMPGFKQIKTRIRNINKKCSQITQNYKSDCLKILCDESLFPHDLQQDPELDSNPQPSTSKSSKNPIGKIETYISKILTLENEILDSDKDSNNLKRKTERDSDISQKRFKEE